MCDCFRRLYRSGVFWHTTKFLGNRFVRESLIYKFICSRLSSWNFCIRSNFLSSFQAAFYTAPLLFYHKYTFSGKTFGSGYTIGLFKSLHKRLNIDARSINNGKLCCDGRFSWFCSRFPINMKKVKNIDFLPCHRNEYADTFVTNQTSTISKPLFHILFHKELNI